MNLAYAINDRVNIDETEYKLNMSFDNILRLFDLNEDETIDDELKVRTGLVMLINDDLSHYEKDDRARIFVDLFKSVIGTEKKESVPVDLDGNPMPIMSDSDKKTHDLVQDAEYIYASFMHTYRIDLFEEQGKLHWDKFKALLNGLDEKSIFNRIVGIRTAEEPTGKNSEKERERIRTLKRKYALKEDDEDD